MNSIVLLKYNDLEFVFYERELDDFHDAIDFRGDPYFAYDFADHYIGSLSVDEDLRFDNVTVDGAFRFIIERKN